ncbi:anillin [Cyprinodon tularosa]|uniref:anillin n=1 Tax=Cyprinodon tularosa TaxID=77115 RepID=UPI0018E2562D|nr:anillin [Cyprinodon tularosa]
MDPFTEKLLERTRARRENLQRKLAERPNAANRQMVKRPREPLTESNSAVGDPAADEAPQISSKPSPSKRRCSEENSAPDENQEPITSLAVAPAPSDPLTDKKPPVGPARVRSSSSLRPAAPQENSAPAQRQDTPTIRATATGPPGSDPQRNGAEEDPAPSAAGMKSRLQRLAEQRKCWDGDEGPADVVPDSTPPTQRQAPADVQPPPSAPAGRRGRLAHLAATIESWEDDLSHAHIPKAKPDAAAAPRFPTRVAEAKQSRAPSVSMATARPASTKPDTLGSPVKSARAVPPSPQKAESPASRPADQSALRSSKQGAVLPSSPLKTPPLPRGVTPSASPRDGATGSASTGRQETTPAGGPGVKSFLERFGDRCQEHREQRTPSASPNTKLVQERLRAAQAAHTATAELTQRQKLERESELALIRSRFQKGKTVWEGKGQQAARADEAQRAAARADEAQRAAARADEAQRAAARADEAQRAAARADEAQRAAARADEAQRAAARADEAQRAAARADEAQRAAARADEAQRAAARADEAQRAGRSDAGDKVQDEPTAPPLQEQLSSEKPREEPSTPSSRHPPAFPGVGRTPPASTSSPVSLAGRTQEVEEQEVSVDQSINSAVINELFDGVLEEEDEEEEDALNISSMSLLTPLAETVAAVVTSPERRLMSSTPASSFLLKRDAPREELQGTRSHGDEDHKLPYSIDAYRSIRVKEPERPAVKQVIVRKEDVSKRAEEPRAASLFSMKQRMKMLSSEMNLQQTVIHQASQALNCCVDEEHGRGSQVEAEAERLLLVATEKREALKAELERLKGEPAGQKKSSADSEPAASKGSITLQELRLPLKADFVCSTANRPDSTKHSFFIVIRAGAENMVATPLASTHRGLSGDTLTFPTKFTLSDVCSDFRIDLDVYCLVQKQELCSEKKKKAAKSKAITPKRFLTITKTAQTPVLASPGGPNAVRSSNFVLVGSQRLTLSSIGKNKFPLEKVPFLCPLEGHIHLRLQCEVDSNVEERGFLTMFEDVSGFGAWHRRWCVLSGYYISYWTYPDDERRKNPIGRINLASCTSQQVEPANREFCARPNTLELITVRPQRKDDRETLVSQCTDTMCVTRNWLSADTKEERNLWMRKLNQVLVDLRMWRPDACSRPQ